ncbi:glycoside hydrolase [Pterulicium gracile]|uniref:AA9 family lytic polysaccharide monooxygenase n=1 Tax=Pterulicium gracile TaxID=1884261 RepID=A0A5C3QA35_9AGAR|nr:glycoside hydrolase [Pterula gracilis]
MKAALATSLAALLVGSASGHTIFQKMYVNGVDQGHKVGIRVASTNNPVMEVTKSDIACNVPSYAAPQSTAVINVPAGASITTEWHHGISAGPDSNDGDDPIASSHKGPVITYLAKVDNAATANPANLKWFKIQEEGLYDVAGQKWAVDKVISNKAGKYTFTMPKCVPSGQYLMRHEIIALHGGASYPGSQFYMGCAQINVTGGGSASPATVSFPGAYKGSDPGITYPLYWPTPSSYTIPGPAVLKC